MSIGALQSLGASSGGFLPMTLLGGNSAMIPGSKAVIDLPEMLDSHGSNRGRLNRAHTKAVRQALFNTMVKHHLTRIPDHFDRRKQTKYHYAKRHQITIQKKGGHAPDIVGRRRQRTSTKENMTRKMTIRMSGTAASGSVTATGVMTWPAGFFHPDKGKINRRVMNEEIAKFTLEETADVGDDFLKEYIRLITIELRTRRVSRKMKANVLSKLGVIL